MDMAIRKFLFVAGLALLSVAPSAFADSTVYVDGTYAFANNGYGIPPYGGTLNGKSASFYCVDFSHDISGGDSWLAVTTPVTPGGNYGSTYLGNPSSPTYAGSNSLAGNDYEVFAWLLTQMTTDSNQSDDAAYQWAIWSLTGGTDPITSGPWDASSLIGDAESAIKYGGYTGSGWEILTPDNGQYGQEFMIKTPEPSSVLLLGVGLCGLLFVKRRERLLS
jgi:PEP-CTERM motif-containing protein